MTTGIRVAQFDGEPSTTSQPISIAHETFGDPSHPAVLLTMGFGTQMLGWDADFCRLLAARGRGPVDPPTIREPHAWKPHEQADQRRPIRQSGTDPCRGRVTHAR